MLFGKIDWTLDTAIAILFKVTIANVGQLGRNYLGHRSIGVMDGPGNGRRKTFFW